MVACKDGAPSGRILLADLWWRNRSGKNLSCKWKMFSHGNWICASWKHVMYGSLGCLKNLCCHNCWNLFLSPNRC